MRRPKVLNRQAKPCIEIYIGATGAGKTHKLMKRIKQEKPKRLMIWDEKGEFADEGYAVRFDSITDLIAYIKDRDSFKVALVPYGTNRVKLFDMFMGVAFEVGQISVIAEELSTVCKGGSCSAANWTKAIMQGRTSEMKIFALTQRPALIDKGALSQATLICAGRLGLPTDAAYLAPQMWVNEADLMSLDYFEFIDFDARKRQSTRGKMPK